MLKIQIHEHGYRRHSNFWNLCFFSCKLSIGFALYLFTESLYFAKTIFHVFEACF